MFLCRVEVSDSLSAQPPDLGALPGSFGATSSASPVFDVELICAAFTTSPVFDFEGSFSVCLQPNAANHASHAWSRGAPKRKTPLGLAEVCQMRYF